MQRHRKYLVVTIWISTIAFVGAGFVGWGQYSYGDKASAIAKVGDISLTQRNFQQAYSRLYGQYNQIFQGNFDESKAKEFGLQQQALRSLIDGALILNLAQTYKIEVSDAELLENIKTQNYFFKDGVFDKETYKKVLAQNDMSMKDYETDTRNGMLTTKVLALFSSEAAALEIDALHTSANIRDRISYKLLTPDAVTITTSDAELKPYWESNRFNYMTHPQYTLETINVEITPSHPSEDEINEYYKANKHNFKDSEGKILALEKAMSAVTATLDEKATNKTALKTYIAFKKGKLDSAVETQTATIDVSNHPYETALFEEITQLSLTQPYLKPRKVDGHYVIVKLLNIKESESKSYEAAKDDVRKQYVSEQKRFKLQELAEQSIENFQGMTTDFLSRDDVSKIDGLNEAEATEFLGKMFESENKRGYIQLSNENIILYAILEQKMLNESITDQANNVMSTKSQILNRGLIKVLEEQYPTEIYVKGL
ncbi:MAG: SurA N-terminal domain-containing protein [Campylobacterota bacterium]|nr:SurA N-terminal domain-containing protein [Campylobacterota bacterium]